MQTANAAFLYGYEVLAIVSGANSAAFLHELKKFIVEKYYAIGISIQFMNLADLQSRYQQTIIAIEEGKTGIYDASLIAYKNLLKNAKEANREAAFLHPALQILKQYDTSHNTELFKTLFEYLCHERNKIETAKVLYLHRNSLSYRLNQIEELTGTNFNKSDERHFALFSFLLENNG
jgi:DNA-binding PucR family transcriptional regulator